MKRCPVCATNYVRGGKFCPQDGSVLEDAPDVGHEQRNSDHLATMPIGLSAEAAEESLSMRKTEGLSAALVGDEAFVGRTIADRYLVEAIIGRGGMGVVYRAQQHLLDRAVAVKVLRPQFVTDERAVGRFLREAKAMARIEHPSAAHVYDFGILPEGGAFLVMELVEGEPLRNVLMRGAPLPLAEALTIAEHVCDAVEAAHGQGVIHRDLKPENVMVRVTPAGPRVKVVDFGLAKIVGAATETDSGHAITASGELFGTPCYMAPEFYEGASIDERADVYAIGIVLYEMLAGLPPFRGSVQTVIGAHLFKEPAPVVASNPDIPHSIDAIIRRALAKERDKRPSSAAELASLLRAAHAEAQAAAEAEAEAVALETPPERLTRPQLRETEGLGTGTTSELATVEQASGGPIAPTEAVPASAFETGASTRWRVFAVGTAIVSILAVGSLTLASFVATADLPEQPVPVAPPAPIPELAAEPEPAEPASEEATPADPEAAPTEPAVGPAKAPGSKPPRRSVMVVEPDNPQAKPAEKDPKKVQQKDKKDGRKKRWFDPRGWF